MLYRGFITHTHTHVHTRTHTRARTHARTHTRTQGHIREKGYYTGGSLHSHEERGEPKRYRTEVLPLTNALPLGQTGSLRGFSVKVCVFLHARTHTHTHTHARTHTHTHTHTRKYRIFSRCVSVIVYSYGGCGCLHSGPKGIEKNCPT